jgi:hypothetical protein
MADKKISALTASTTPLAGTEVLPIVQGGSTVKVAVSNLTAGRAVATGALTVTGALSATMNSATAFDATDPATWNAVVISNTTSGALNNMAVLFATESNGEVFVGAVENAGNTAADLVIATRSAGARAERMRVAANGIVTMNAYGAGAATFSAAGVISSVSDETWKIKDGVPTDPDAMLKKLEPGYWYYNDEKKETFGVDRQLGFYAQNVNAAIGPEAAPEPETFITKNEDGIETTVSKPWGYYDRSVLAITVMSLQKALATIDSLTARIAVLEAK